MRKFLIVLTLTSILTTMASAASASSASWKDADSRYGTVTVSSDRKHITVCGTSADSTEVWAEYATSYLLTHTVKDKKGGGLACAEDTVYLGYITVFKLCFLHNHVAEKCNNSIWINR